MLQMKLLILYTSTKSDSEIVTIVFIARYSPRPPAVHDFTYHNIRAFPNEFL